jgi:hypothetical protein
MPAIGESEKLDSRWPMTLAGLGCCEGVCQIRRDLLFAEKPLANRCSRHKWALAIGCSGFHDAQQGWPIHLIHPTQLARRCVQQARQIRRCQNKSPFIETSSSGPAKHLQQLVGPEFALKSGVSVAG